MIESLNGYIVAGYLGRFAVRKFLKTKRRFLEEGIRIKLDKVLLPVVSCQLGSPVVSAAIKPNRQQTTYNLSNVRRVASEDTENWTIPAI